MASSIDDDLLPNFEGLPWADWLCRRRWFVRRPDAPQPELASLLMLPSGPLCLVESGDDLYFVPLAVASDEDQDAMVDDDGVPWIDGLEDEECVGSLLEACLDRPQGGKAFRLVPEVFDRAALEASLADGTVRLGSAEQTNSWAVCGDSFLKIFRRLDTEPNLDVEVLQVLAGRQDLSVPRLRGILSARIRGSESTLVAVQAAIEHQGNAWERACAEVGSAARGTAPDGALWSSLGRRTGELHLALAEELGSESSTSAQGIEASTAAEALARAVLADLADASRDSWTESVSDLADQVLRGSASLVASLREPSPAGTPFQRVHGDFHLGQVLRASGDWVILDFEGEPSRSPAERRTMAPAAKDVSGMLRSFDYATRAGLPEGADEAARSRVAEWKRVVRAAFLDGYFATPGIEATWPADPAACASLLAFYEAEKAFYELRYELAHRPDWLAIPLGGLLSLVPAKP